jgi:hypothetical protein
MIHQFQKHYTRDEARTLLPQVRQWLERLKELRDELEGEDEHLGKLLATGCDLGGPKVNRWVRTMAAIKETLLEFHRREIQLKDLDRGLIDFPAIMDGKEVFLCWESGEDDIAYWHDLEAGYAGREPLEE